MLVDPGLSPTRAASGQAAIGATVEVNHVVHVLSRVAVHAAGAIRDVSRPVQAGANGRLTAARVRAPKKKRNIVRAFLRRDQELNKRDSTEVPTGGSAERFGIYSG